MCQSDGFEMLQWRGELENILAVTLLWRILHAIGV